MKTNQDFPTITARREIFLRVRELMAVRGVKNTAELHRRLISSGVDISNAQLVRIIDGRADRLNLHVVNGLLNLFQCSVHDLFGEKPVEETSSESSQVAASG